MRLDSSYDVQRTTAFCCLWKKTQGRALACDVHQLASHFHDDPVPILVSSDMGLNEGIGDVVSNLRHQTSATWNPQLLEGSLPRQEQGEPPPVLVNWELLELKACLHAASLSLPSRHSVRAPWH